jgi:hypothetical protein
VVALQAHQAGSPGNVQILNNTIINDSAGLEVRNVVGPVLIANNAIYSQNSNAIRLISGSLNLVTVAGNVGQGGLSGGSSGYTEGKGMGADFINGHYGIPPIDLFPKSGSALIGAASAAHITTLDFNGNSRTGTNDVGAYRYSSSGNPGWVISAGFKTGGNVVRPNPPTNVTAE